MQNKQRAFSLIELSISLLIIALIMSIIAGSIKLISSSRLTNARSLTLRSPVPNISGLVAWYETSRLESLKPKETLENAQISAWYDTSPESIAKQKNTLTRTASSAVTYQENGVNKIPGIYFDGSGRLSVSNFYQGTTSQNTIFIVAKPATITNIIIGSGSTNAAIGQNHTAFSLNCGTLVNTGTVTNPINNITHSPYIAAIYLNSVSSGVYFNDATNIAGGSSVNPGNAVLTGLSVAATRTDELFFSGVISEIIIYNRPLQSQERRDVMGYLAQKYNLKISGL